MNITPNQKANLALGMLWIGGATFGSIVTKLVLDRKYQEELKFNIESLENSYEAALTLRDAASNIRLVNDIEEGLAEMTAQMVVDPNFDTSISDVDAPDYIGSINDRSTNPYHQAVVSSEDAEPAVVNADADYGVSYIEEDDYHDEDGREKKQIDIMFDDDQPVFIMDSEQIEDWSMRIGESILVDFFKLCPPGTPAILYVRNHRTEVDYEVVRVEP